MSKIKVYLKNSDALARHEVTRVLTEFSKQIEYTNNWNNNDVSIDCKGINKDNIRFHKANILKQVQNEINKRKRNPLRNYI